MKISEYPVWLAVPQKELAAVRKAAGLLPNGQSAIEWNKENKLWFARPGCDIDRVQDWLPDRSIRAGGGDPESEFLDVLTQAGLVVKGMPVMNGQRQRVSTTDDKNGKKSGVYSGYLDRRPGGWFINYHRADNAQDVTKWVATGGEADPVARLHIRAAAKQSQEDAARDRAATHAERTLAAGKLYARLPAADPLHPYLVRKGITPTPEVRQTRNGALVVPFFDAQGIFKTLQYIPEAGEKLLFKDAPKQGHFLVVGGPLLPGQPIQYAEGYATARSLNIANGRPVVMTIDAGNMVAVARILHQQFPDSQHMFMADFDHAKAENKGWKMANEAAALVGGVAVYPAFNEAELALGLTDFNDLHQSRGLDAVRDQTAHLFVLPEEVPTVQEQQSHQSPLEGDLPIATPSDTQSLASVEAGTPQAANQENQNANGVAATEAASAPAPESSAIGPQPLNFTHNGQPVSLNLEDHRPGQLPDAKVIRPIESFAPPMPSFTFNGQPASLTPVQAPATVDQPAVTALREEPALDAVSRVAEFSEPAPAFASVQLSPEAASITSDGVEKSSAPTPAMAAEIVPPAEPASLAQDSSAEASVLVEQSRIEAPGGLDAVPPAALVNETIDQADVAPLVAAKAPVSATTDADVPANEAQDLSALLPRRFRSQKGAEPSGEDATDAINVGARIGVDEPPQEPSLIDKDALLTRVTHETQNDNSVLYKLDNEPAFVDRGSRLEMAPGAGQSDEKIMAALLTAARFYRGQIELTGSDAFKAKAIELIAQHQVNVSMKNPAQQLMLDVARKAQVVTAEKPDMVMGDTPPPYDPVAVPHADNSQPPPLQANVPGEPVVSALAATTVTHSLPEHLIAPDPLDDSAYSARMPLETRSDVTSAPSVENVTSSTGKSESDDPSVHQSYKAAQNGVTGKIIDFGTAPFKFDPDNTDSVFIKLRTKTGTQTYWGKELAGVLRQTRVEKGRMATLKWLGHKDVVVQAPVKDESGAVIRYIEKDARRNQWSLAMLNGPVVRTGDDQGVTLAAYDAARFGMIQSSVMAQLKLPIESPSLPRDGLFWLTPNGQGSAKAGDELSAQRPAVDSQEAGKPVMSSWSHDGQLDMALFRGDGPYLQGVVRQGDAYQHVLVSLPGHSDAPPMVFNMITEQGLVPIGVGNGINRSNGEAVSRENVAYRLEGDTSNRIAKLDFPAEVPPALHHRLGFDERFKDTNTLPKSPPAAAPVAQPGALRPS